MSVDVLQPALSAAPSESELLEYAETVCIEPCDRAFLLLVLLDSEGVPVQAPARLHGVARLPRRADVDQVLDMVTGVATQVGARSCVLVWQALDDGDLEAVCAQHWVDALAPRLSRGPLRSRGQVHRTPSGFRVLRPGETTRLL